MTTNIHTDYRLKGPLLWTEWNSIKQFSHLKFQIWELKDKNVPKFNAFAWNQIKFFLWLNIKPYLFLLIISQEFSIIMYKENYESNNGSKLHHQACVHPIFKMWGHNLNSSCVYAFGGDTTSRYLRGIQKSALSWNTGWYFTSIESIW